MALDHRLARLERHAPPPYTPCAECGIPGLRDGRGAVRPGWVLPPTTPTATPILLGCKACFSWVRTSQMPSRNPDGSFHLTSAERCEPPNYL